MVLTSYIVKKNMCHTLYAHILAHFAIFAMHVHMYEVRASQLAQA